MQWLWCGAVSGGVLLGRIVFEAWQLEQWCSIHSVALFEQFTGKCKSKLGTFVFFFLNEKGTFDIYQTSCEQGPLFLLVFQ